MPERHESLSALATGSREVGGVPVLHEPLGTFARHAEITPTGLRFTGQISYEQWAAFGDTLWRLEEATRWCLGDWYLHGEAAFEEHAQALPNDQYRLGTLQQYAWVASRVKPNTRVKFSTLPWVHFREVSSLETPEQEELLRAAEEHGWTRRQLHEAVRAYKHQLKGGGEKKATPQNLSHVAREYQVELDQICSVLEPLVRSANDLSLERLHRQVKDAIRRVIEHCISNASQDSPDQSGDEGADTCAETKLIVGSDWAPEERGVEHVCPGCGGGMGEDEALCEYAADERIGMQEDEWP